jgi:hypothetical protein
MRALRWLLLLVAVGASGALAVVLSLCFVSATDVFCPANELVSGVCTARWAPAAYSTGFCIATSIGAVLAVSSAYYTSPAGRRLATWCVVTVGRLCGLPLSGRAGLGVLPCHCRCSRRSFHSHQICIARHATPKRLIRRCSERLPAVKRG